MNALTTYDSTKEALSDLLRSVQETLTQLPEFQRGWVWDDDHIRSLLASISLSYPIGVVMMLETGNKDVRFKPRVIEGIDPAKAQEPDRLILDGQQRLTALYQSLYNDKSVLTTDARGKKIKRWYFIDIAKSLNLNGDRDEAIVSIPEDLKMRNFRGEVLIDCSSNDKQFENGLFPLQKVLDSSDWRLDYNQFWDNDRDKAKLFDAFEKEVIKRFEQYQVPLIILRKETQKEAVCQVFERVNTGGVSLTVFELLTATYAVDDYDLRDDWNKRGIEGLNKNFRVLESIDSTDFLQTLTLLATYARRNKFLDNGGKSDDAPGISCKRKEILRITLEEYKGLANQATKGFERSAKFLLGQKIFKARDLPYRTQITPLAAIHAVLGNRFENDGIRTKIARWYWCGVFGELYGGAIETRFAKDLPQVLDWLDGGPEPDTIQDANFMPSRLLTLRTRNSAAYKGLYALLLRDGLDFRTGFSIKIHTDSEGEDKIDIHHIFPQQWCKENGKDPRLFDSIVNKTVLSAKTNKMIGGNAPSQYLPRIQKKAGIPDERMDQILLSHAIDTEALRADKFETFFKLREQALLESVETAIGKPVAREFTKEPSIINEYDYEENKQVHK